MIDIRDRIEFAIEELEFTASQCEKTRANVSILKAVDKLKKALKEANEDSEC